MAKFVMKYVIFALVFAVIRAKAETSNRVSKKEVKEKKTTETPLARRFLEDLDDEQWHVAHLKESDFDDVKDARRSGCKEESFQEKVKKYRRSLKRDAGRLEYVSANALPFNLEDIHEEICKIEEEPNVQKSYNKTTLSITKDTKVQKATTTDKITNSTVTNSTEHKATQNDSDILTPILKNDTRKSGDYLISSVEYYDDVVDFDEKLCPSVVDVVPLEQDLIRNYDVECELTLKWLSLE